MSSQEQVVLSSAYVFVDLYKSILCHPALSVAKHLTLLVMSNVFTRARHVIQSLSVGKCLTLLLMSSSRREHNHDQCNPICCQAVDYVVDVKFLHKNMSYQPALSVFKCLTLLLMSNLFTRARHNIQSCLLASVLLRCRCLHESIS